MNIIERYFVKRFIRKSMKKANNADARDVFFMMEEMVKSAREFDTEANDSTIYATLMEKMDTAAVLNMEYVCDGIRFKTNRYREQT